MAGRSRWREGQLMRWFAAGASHCTGVRRGLPTAAAGPGPGRAMAAGQYREAGAALPACTGLLLLGCFGCMQAKIPWEITESSVLLPPRWRGYYTALTLLLASCINRRGENKTERGNADALINSMGNGADTERRAGSMGNRRAS